MDHLYRLIIICGFIVIQRFDRGEWHTRSKSKVASVDGLAIWKDTKANRHRAIANLDDEEYQTIEAPQSWDVHESAHGWHGCNGKEYTPPYSTAKEAVLALVSQLDS